MQEYTNCEYVISVGEGKLYAFGKAEPFVIKEKTNEALMAYHAVTCIIEPAIPSTETGDYKIAHIYQVCN